MDSSLNIPITELLPGKSLCKDMLDYHSQLNVVGYSYLNKFHLFYQIVDSCKLLLVEPPQFLFPWQMDCFYFGMIFIIHTKLKCLVQNS